MTDKVFCKIYFQELNSMESYLGNFPDHILKKKI